MYNNMNGYAPYRSSSGGRMWGMSHSLPSGMDTDFTSSYPTTTRRMYSEFPTSSTLASVGHMSSSSTSSLAGPGGGTNLIVNYLPQDMTDRELYALFRTMGPVNTCRIMRDFKTGYSFGYAFVDFSTEQDAIRAIKSLNGVTVRNKRLKVSYARPSGDHIKDTNLYVTNLPRTITEEQLDVIFGKYGQIVQKNILRDKLTGAPRGVAFVRFNKREEAQEAISALNNVIPEGGTQPLTVRVAEEHGNIIVGVLCSRRLSLSLSLLKLKRGVSTLRYSVRNNIKNSTNANTHIHLGNAINRLTQQAKQRQTSPNLSAQAPSSCHLRAPGILDDYCRTVTGLENLLGLM